MPRGLPREEFGRLDSSLAKDSPRIGRMAESHDFIRSRKDDLVVSHDGPPTDRRDADLHFVYFFPGLESARARAVPLGASTFRL